MKIIGVIILNYNTFKDTISLVKSIKHQKSPYLFKIVIVDNCSMDRSLEELKKQYLMDKNVDIIKTKKNNGYGAGNNFGINYLTIKYNPDYLMICNPDIKIDIQIIPKIIEAFNIDRMIAAVSIQMVDENHKKKLSAWKLPTLLDDIILSLFILKKFFKKRIEYSNQNKSQYVEVLQGAFFIVKPKPIKEVGGFDEKIFLYGEERILGFKLKKAGYKLFYIPKYTFIHSIGISIEKKFPTKFLKFTILQKSRRYYHANYLKQHRIKLIFFDFCTFLGKIEKYLYDLVQSIIMFFQKYNAKKV